MLLLAVGKTALQLVIEPGSMVWVNIPDLTAWILWAVSVLTIWFGPVAAVRWLTIGATLAYGAAMIVWLARGDSSAVVNGATFWYVQVAIVALTWDHQRVIGGRMWLKQHPWWVAGVLVLVLVSLRIPLVSRFDTVGGVYWPAALAAAALLAAAVLSMRTAVGRAVLPIMAGVVALLIAQHGWWTGIGSLDVWTPTSNLPSGSDLFKAAITPLTAWAILRTLTALINRSTPRTNPG